MHEKSFYEINFNIQLPCIECKAGGIGGQPNCWLALDASKKPW
jgi:hypothetical protein